MTSNRTFELLEYVGDSIFLLQRTTIIWQNEKSKEYFSEAVGYNCFDFLLLDKASTLVEAITNGRRVDFETRVFAPRKGGWYYFEVTYVPEGEALILKDVTQKKQLNDAKLNLSVMLVHEIKNPLGALKTLLSEMVEEEDDPKKLETLWKAERQLARLERIVQQVEQITLAQLGLYRPKSESIDVRSLVEDVCDELEKLRSEKNIEIVKNLKTQTLLGDKFIVKTILKNLLSNAIKYSLQDSKVVVEVTDDRLVVRDFGVGVPESEVERIFERFYRTPIASKMAPGSGLGLSVVKHLVNLAGYKLDFESKYMIGTTVTVHLNPQCRGVPTGESVDQ